METHRIFTLKDQLEAVCEVAKNVIGDLVYPGTDFLIGNVPLTEDSLYDLEVGACAILEDCFDFSKLMIKGLQRLHCLFEQKRKSKSVRDIISEMGAKIEINNQTHAGHFRSHTVTEECDQNQVVILDPPESPYECYLGAVAANPGTSPSFVSTTPNEKHPTNSGPVISAIHRARSSSQGKESSVSLKELKKKRQLDKRKRPMLTLGHKPEANTKIPRVLIRGSSQTNKEFDFTAELLKLSGSSAVSDLQILCGICKQVKQIDGNRRNFGKVNYFYRKHYAACLRRHSTLSTKNYPWVKMPTESTDEKGWKFNPSSQANGTVLELPRTGLYDTSNCKDTEVHENETLHFVDSKANDSHNPPCTYSGQTLCPQLGSLEMPRNEAISSSSLVSTSPAYREHSPQDSSTFSMSVVAVTSVADCSFPGQRQENPGAIKPSVGRLSTTDDERRPSFALRAYKTVL